MLTRGCLPSDLQDASCFVGVDYLRIFHSVPSTLAVVEVEVFGSDSL